MTNDLEIDTDAVTVRGFILQPTYRIRRGRPVVHLFGVLEDGGGFLVRDGSLIPHFYIEETDAERALELGASRQEATDKVTLGEGRPVVRVDLDKPSDTPPLRDRLQEHGIRCWEADVRFAMRFLIDRGLRGSIEIHGVPRTYDDHVRLTVFDDPELSRADWTPELRMLSLDIETDARARRLLSIALHGCGASEVLLLTAEGQEVPEKAVPFPTEAELLAGFTQRVRELDPDGLTGWNVVDFDLAVLARRAQELEVPLGLGRVPGKLQVQPSRFRGGSSRATVPGRLVLDGIELLRGSFVTMDDWSLDAVARETLGEGKTLGGEGGGKNKLAEIQRTFRDDRARFVEYNLTDARLVTDILDKLHVVELAVERSRLTGLPPDRVSGSIAAFDFLYLSELGRRGAVAPTVGSGPDVDEPTHGGYVLEPTPGLYENVLVFDFQSLYPSLIRTFQIDPLGHLPEWSGEGGSEHDALEGSAEPGPIVAPNGAAFRRERGILTRMLDELFPRRAEAKRRGDDVATYAIKILMNSFYGVLATPACRFHDPRIANAITSFGRELLLWCRSRIEEEHDRKVLYGDTDSLFVESGDADPVRARAFGDELLRRLNRELAEYIRERWQVESRLVLEFDRLYLKLLLPEVRGGGGHGARKRYAGLIERQRREGVEQETVFTGLEVVRRDWTELARRVQRELYERLFTDRPVAEYLRREVEELRAGQLDALLVYHKGLRKELSEYTSTTPPHVAAARKMSGDPGRVVAYVWTRNGPEPAEERESPFDYEHYVEKQILPVAEPVLGQLGLDFAKVIGDDRQMELF